MKVVVTGGLGFLGMEVCKRLLRRGTAFSPVAKAARDITELTIFDSAPAELMPAEVAADSRVKLVGGAVSESGWVSKLVDTEDIAVFHFVSMMSGNSEADFDAAWDVNVLAQRQLLEALRELPTTPRFFFTSSTASLGADAAKQGANDLTKLVPEGTYGFTKSVCELMLNEYSRRSFVDGRGLRLPVVIVRPGAPNAAATGCYSGVVREPLNGEIAISPLPLDLAAPVTSYQVACDNIVQLMDVEAEKLGVDRMFMQPSISTTCEQLYASAGELARERGISLGGVEARVDPVAARVVGGMTPYTDGSRALSIGLRGDESTASIVRMYADDNLARA